jgi:hypothetical protein
MSTAERDTPARLRQPILSSIELNYCDRQQHRPHPGRRLTDRRGKPRLIGRRY